MDNKSTTKRMIGAVVLVLIAALLLAWLLKGKNRSVEQRDMIAEQTQGAAPILGFPGVKQEAGGVISTEQGAAGDTEYAIGTEVVTNSAAQGTEATSQAANTVTQPIAVTANKNDVNSNFQVRDEVRPVIKDGEAQPGTGSMGTDEIAVNAEGAGTTTVTENVSTTTAETAAPATAATTTTKAAVNTASNNDRPAASSANNQDVKTARVANPRLVNERPVPPPPAQPRNQGTVVRATTPPATTTKPATTTTASTSKPAATAESSAASSASAAASAAAKRDGYVIQILATSSEGKANEIRQAIAGDGYPAFITRTTVDGKPVYRVRVGTYPGRNDAAAIQTRMKSRYAQNQFIQNSFVTKN